MKFFRYRRPSLNTLLGITKAKKRMKKELGITDGDEAVPVVDEHEAAVQAEDRLRIGGRAADSEWTAEAGRVLGGGHCGGNAARGDGGCARGW